MVGAAGFEPAAISVSGERVAGTADSPTRPCVLRSGAENRTPISWLTASGPAFRRHRIVNAALCRLFTGHGARLAFVAGAGFEPALPGYEPGEVPNSSNPL
jgi:hypothetical protein